MVATVTPCAPRCCSLMWFMNVKWLRVLEEMLTVFFSWLHFILINTPGLVIVWYLIFNAYCATIGRWRICPAFMAPAGWIPTYHHWVSSVQSSNSYTPKFISLCFPSQGLRIRFPSPLSLCQRCPLPALVLPQTHVRQTGRRDLRGFPQGTDRPTRTPNPTSVTETLTHWPYYGEKCLSLR